MIPIRDQNPTTARPVLTIALIALNVLVFLREPITASNVEQTKFFYCHAAVPKEVFDNKPLGPITLRADTGAVVEISCPHKNVWFSIFYSMFLHGSILHIAGNMLYLWIFGNNIEDKLGRWRFLVFYFGAGLAATYAHSFVAGGASAGPPSLSAVTPMVGASGAIAGVLGAYLLLFPRARITTLIIFFFITSMEVPAYVLLGFWFVMQLLSGVASVGATASSGVAFFAHVGGFLAGMLLLLVLNPRRRAPPRALPPEFA
jgi:membrane associated rhomboid family serine protease